MKAQLVNTPLPKIEAPSKRENDRLEHETSKAKPQDLPWLDPETLQVLSLEDDIVAEKTIVLEINLSFCRLEVTDSRLPLTFGQRYFIKAQSKESGFDLWVHALLTECDPELGIYEFCFMGIENKKIRTPEPAEREDVIELGASSSFATASGRHPWFLSEGLVFTIAGVFRKGLVLSEELNRMNLLEVGEKLALEIHFPSVGTIDVRGLIRRTYVKDSCQIIHLEITRMSDRYKRLLSRHLGLTVRNHPIDMFKQLDLPIPEYRYSAEVGIVCDEMDERACLELRKKAYTEKPTSKLDPNIDAAMLKDRFDGHSLIMAVKVLGQVVGTGRLIFNNRVKDESEVAQYFGLDSQFWREGFIEASRFATNENFRRGDIFLLLVYLTFKISYQSRCRYVIVECEEHLVPMYQRLGAKRLNMTVTHPMENLTLHLVVFDVSSVATGKIGSRMNWYIFWAPAVNHLSELGALNLPFFTRTLIRLAAKIPQDVKRKWLKKLHLKG